MLRDSKLQIKAIIARLRELGVQSILSTHCTGDHATKQRFLIGGAGVHIPLD